MAAEIEVKKQSWVENTRAYIGDIRSEMRRVTWPSRKQVESTTLVVILSVFAFAAYFRIVDQIIQETVVRAQNALLK
ncbi:MAG TPA: preprotein translocase subunit SecE [Bryobacteraceae bacterium]|jgi:preprotein translocase subunit SecE|nr:preprotein translocase subunit SecE [Bryobacteraceae bacterium]